MRTIFWIMGGTASGKKTYIKHVATKTIGVVSWIEDGDKLASELLEELEQFSLLVRWQWGREHTLAEIAENHPNVNQQIIYLHAYPKIQKSRADGREPELIRTKSDLEKESKGVNWLALGLAEYYSLDFNRVDVSSNDKSLWKLPSIK